MYTRCLHLALASVMVVVVHAIASTHSPDEPVPGWQGLNPRMLSGARYLAIRPTAAGNRTPPRARSVDRDLSKGRPGVVLDARVGPNQYLGNDSSLLPAAQRGQAEPHLVRSATNPQLLLAAFQEGRFAEGGGGLTCGCAHSRDGGLTWTRQLLPKLNVISGGRYLRATDPVAAIGPQGEFYVNTLAARDDGFGEADIVMSRSLDGGSSWSDPIVIFQSPSPRVAPDKNWITANEFPATVTSGRLVCSWTNFTRDAAGSQTGNNILASVSDDQGRSWAAPIEVTPTGSSNQGSLPIFLPDGGLTLVYVSFLNRSDPTRFSIQCKLSRDGGRSFPNAATTVVAAVSAWDDPELREGLFLPSAAIARDTGTLFVAYVAVADGTPRVMVTRSRDQGATWTRPQAVSDQPFGLGVANAAVAVSPDGATVAVVFMDKRNAPEGRGIVDHYAAISNDGGTTWQPNLRLTDLSSDLRFAPLTPTGYMLGDYLAVAPSVGQREPCVAIWCDTRTGDADPYVVRFSPAPVPDYAAWTLAHGTDSATGPIDLAVDTDHDGVSDLLEYLSGTDPRSAETGAVLHVRRSSREIVDVLWTERPGLPTLEAERGVTWVDVDSPSNATATRFLSPFANPIPRDEMPSIVPTPGLVWQGVRLIATDDKTIDVAPALRAANSGQVRTSSLAATRGTNSRLVNLSVSARLNAASRPLIVGFAIDGEKSVLLRAAGPALLALGATGVLNDPRLSISPAVATARPRAANDDWNQGPATSALFARIGAFPFPVGSGDAALVELMPRGAYTALISGPDGAAGTTLMEAYDADESPGRTSAPRLLNLSARAEITAGSPSVTAGFVLSGNQPRRAPSCRRPFPRSLRRR